MVSSSQHKFVMKGTATSWQTTNDKNPTPTGSTTDIIKKHDGGGLNRVSKWMANDVHECKHNSICCRLAHPQIHIFAALGSSQHPWTFTYFLTQMKTAPLHNGGWLNRAILSAFMLRVGHVMKFVLTKCPGKPRVISCMNKVGTINNDNIDNKSFHQLQTAVLAFTCGYARAERPKDRSGRTGDNRRGRYVSKSRSGVSSCVNTSACYTNIHSYA